MTLDYKAYVTSRFQVLSQNTESIIKGTEYHFSQKHFPTFFLLKSLKTAKNKEVICSRLFL